MKVIKYLLLTIVFLSSSYVFPSEGDFGTFAGEIIDCFAEKNDRYEVEGLFKFVKLIQTEYQDVPMVFFGIHDKHRDTFENDKELRSQIKTAILKRLGIPSRQIIQFVGDSRPFSKEGTDFGKEYLKKYLKSYPNAVLEYGLTGSDYIKNPSTLDINAFVNEYVDQHTNKASNALANIVGHTKVAVCQWGFRASVAVKNHVVVYNDAGIGEGFTKFGDDTFVSDLLLNPRDGDRLVVYDGGIQSFTHIANGLKVGIPIDMVYGLRKVSDTNFFSAAEFVHQVFNVLKNSPNLTKKDVYHLYLKYAETHQAWDPKRRDTDTKARLFKEAMHTFIEDGAYLRLKKKELFTFRKVIVDPIVVRDRQEITLTFRVSQRFRCKAQICSQLTSFQRFATQQMKML